MTIYERIKNRRKELKISQDELAQLLGYTSRSSISKIESGENDIPQSKVKAFAKALKTTPGYLMGWEEPSFNVFDIPGIMPLNTKKVPLLGTIAAGVPIPAEEEAEEYIECDLKIKADFCLRIKGDSMSPKINDGDLVFIHQQPQVENGQIAAVFIDGEATLKRIYQTDNAIQLVSENLEFPPIIYTKNDCDSIKIIGKAIAFQRYLK